MPLAVVGYCYGGSLAWLAAHAQTNGKAERFNRTLAEEFLYARCFRSKTDRRIRLKRWICDYNCHRHHTAVGGPPASRANNLTRTDT